MQRAYHQGLDINQKEGHDKERYTTQRGHGPRNLDFRLWFLGAVRWKFSVIFRSTSRAFYHGHLCKHYENLTLKKNSAKNNHRQCVKL